MMCSIPGLPSPGLEVSVLITRVNLKSSHGLLELWVSMDGGKKDIYEQMKEEIQTPQRHFYRSEGKPGDLCVVCIKDKWHRARIVSIQSETYNVFLIDQSQPHTTTSESLAWSKRGSFLLPPEIELCILANVIPLQNEWDETASKFLMCLPRKKFKGLVQDVFMPDRIILLEIPVVANYMCKLGVAKKIKVDQSKGLLQKYLHAVREDLSESLCLTMEPEPDVPCHFVQCDHYFYPELTIDTFETVYVTEIINPLNIFCMLFIFSKAVKLLSEQIHQHYEASSDFGPAHPQSCGDPCAARGTDGKWRRSLLKQNIETSEDAVKDDIEVFHVDAGKTELVKAEDIRPLHGKFLKMPVVTYLCSLNKITYTNREEAADKTDDLKSMLLNQMVVARFDHYNKRQDIYYVTLYSAYNACVNDIFLEKAGHVSFSESEQDSNVHNNALFPISLEEKKTIDLLFKAKEVGFQEETGSGTKIQVGNDCVDSSTSGNITHPKRSSVPVLHNNGHLSSSLLSEVQNACDDSVFAVGKTVNVKVSCIESPQKFWCQATESADSFRHLMQDLQAHYAFAHPQPLVESICVARNPENKMWYRASIIARHDTPTVDVRFIDYGQTQSIPLRDVHPIDPVFLQLKAQAFQCCLFILNNPTEPTLNSWTDAEFNEFLKFVDPGTSSDTELKCLVKAVTSDEDGLLVNVVDIQRESKSVCELLTQKRAQSKVQEQMPSSISLDGYCYSTLNIEVGGEETVLVTSAKTVSHFYCQLHRNAHVLDKRIKNIAKLLDKPQNLGDAPELNSICLARHNDKWYRGQIVETSPKLKVHFVDYGDTLAISKSNIYPFPSGSSIAKFVPVQAIPLALFDMPTDVPQDVNQWFADFAVGHCFTITVVAKSEERKLIVEMFDGSLNVNTMVREKVEKMKLAKTFMNQHTDKHLSVGLKASLPDGNNSDQELNGASVIKTTDQDKDNSWNTHKDSPPQMEQEKVLDGRNPTLGVVSVKETISETSIQGSPSFPKMTLHSIHVCPEGKGKIYRYKWPTVSQNMIVDAHASYIVGPDHFWCQYTNTEDLNIVTKFAEEAGQAHTVFPSGELEPGSQCIAFSNNLWYRAQVIQKTDKTLQVLLVDYGNESVIDINKVKPLPYHLLEIPPQAFLCCLNGFIKSSGSWDDKVHDEFSKLLVNKPLKVTMVDLENDMDIGIPRYTVIAECDHVIINEIMQKHWKSFSGEHPLNSVTQTDILPQSIQTESNITKFASRETTSTSISSVPGMAESQAKMVYTSFIAKPSFFWCQLANTEDLDEVSHLSQEAGQAEEDTIFSKALGPGSPCLALFPSDNQWYRAQVLHKSEETLHVLFVDYGNESEVDIKNVRPLTQSLLEIAPQAFLCCLNGFDESKGSWKNEASDAFYNLLVDKPLKLTVVDMNNHSEIAVPQYSVEIEHEEVNIHASMLQYWKPVTEESSMTKNQQTTNSSQVGPDHSDTAHLCVSKTTLMKVDTFKDPVISRAQTEMMYASCISEPSFFWCQLANTEDLDEVSHLSQEAGQAEEDTIFSKALDPGSPCLAMFPSDNQWYRAQVLHKSEETLHVLFVDYGNESEVDIKNIKPLTQRLLEIAPQAFLCCLNGFDESKGSWKDEASDAFYNFLVDKPLKLTVVDMNNHSEIAVPQYSVEIEHEEVNIHAAMLQYWKPVTEESSMTKNQQTINSSQVGPDHSDTAHLCVSKTTLMKADTFKDPVISRAQTEMMYASCVSQPSFFWCQLANTEDLDEVSHLSQEAGQAEEDTIFSKALCPGSPCLALFPSDNQWYRAQVLHKSEETLHVLFVDYGNESEVDIKNIKPLTQRLLEIAPQAFLCCLNGFDESKGSWKNEASDAFYNLLVDKPLKLTVVDMNNHSEIAVPQYSVEIEHEEVNIHAAMLQYWKPVTEESSMTENQQTVNSSQVGPDHSDTAHLCVSKTTLMKVDTFKEPVISRAQTEMMYASCISEPSFFWCQLANTEDLDEVSHLSQEAGQAEEDTIFSKALGPGSPCLALFPSDNQWYRAQVLHKSEETLHVLFVDYGNESEVDIKNIKPLTQRLLEIAPQAFLCCLSGFDESKGSWKNEASDAFYNLLADKPLKLTVVSMNNHSEIAVPQYSVKIEHEGVVVNMMMEKYWRAESLETASNPTMYR